MADSDGAVVPDTPVIGREFAGFTLESFIAEGSTGSVYTATGPRDTRVALKILNPALAGDERFRARFLREAQLAATLESASIVPTIASGEHDGLLFLAMAYIDGPDLRQVLRHVGRLDVDRVLRILDRVAEALDAAHAAGLVHRDVKPGNILLEVDDGEERAFVCDFGLARHLSSPSSLTGDRGFLGTIDYVPPEQIEGGTIDGRADVYSLGCVLFECLTGTRPFDRESELATVFAHLNEPTPRVSEFVPALPLGLDAVVEKALAKDASARFATCGDLARAARDAVEGRYRPTTRRAGRTLVGVAAATLVVVALAIGVARSDGSQERIPARPTITPAAIDGIGLGKTAAEYRMQLVRPGGEPGFTATRDLASSYTTYFFRKRVAVSFPPGTSRATIVVTWNRGFRTAAGVGPCSTLHELKRAYGSALRASWAGTSPDGSKTWSWLVGRNLLFTAQTPDRQRITAVALYRGDGTSHGGNPESWANYLAANAPWCTSD